MDSKDYVKVFRQILKWSNKMFPILQELKVKDHRLQATDLEVWAEVDAPVDLTDRMLDPNVMEYTLEPTGSNPNDFPNLELPPILQEVELAGEDMTNLLWCAKFVSKDQTRPVLTGVAITSEGKCYGTDGYRAARRPLSFTITPSHLTLPTKALTLLRLAGGAKRNWTMTIYGKYEPEMVAFKSGDLTIYSKLIDGQIPYYDDVMVGKWNRMATIPKGVTIPKDYYIVFGNDKVGDNKLYFKSKADGRTIPTSIPVEDWEDATDSDTLDIVMGTGGKPTMLDPESLKPWKGKGITLYIGDYSVIKVREL